MYKLEMLLQEIDECPSQSQRQLSKSLGISLGSTNALIAEALEHKYISKEPLAITKKGTTLLRKFTPDAAIILAAGFGSRFVPLTYDTPKGLLEVHGERMIERQIRQLLEVGVHDIYIVVGYLKEKFDYLIDKYGVRLIYNPDYSTTNSISSVWHAREHIYARSIYMLNSDNWMQTNPFSKYEFDSWYSCSYMKGATKEWCVTCDKYGAIKDVHIGGRDCWVMNGPAFLSKAFTRCFIPLLNTMYHTPGYENVYWEDVFLKMLHPQGLLRNGLCTDTSLLRDIKDADMYAKKMDDGQLYEFENLEELRAFDTSYNEDLDNESMKVISKALSVPQSQIKKIRCLKKGMTNRSFLFEVDGRDYICRVPGEGTDRLIDRKSEGLSIKALAGRGISEHVIYFDEKTGYKVAEYYENSRNLDASSMADVKRAMSALRAFHCLGIKFDMEFDIKKKIAFYEKLCLKNGSIPFEDYRLVRSHMDEIFDILSKIKVEKIFCHVDCVPDNILFIKEGKKESIKFIDWEYAGMADPAIDIAMFAIYAYYSEQQALGLYEMYLERKPTTDERVRLFAYMAAGGLLWALWAVYKSQLGTDFSDYTLVQYRYAKTCYNSIVASCCS